MEKRKTIGRRTRTDILTGKTVRKTEDGMDVFGDYWTDSDDSTSILTQSNCTNISGKSQGLVDNCENEGSEGRSKVSDSPLKCSRILQRVQTDVLAGKNLKKNQDGKHVFDDYWTDSGADSSISYKNNQTNVSENSKQLIKSSKISMDNNSKRTSRTQSEVVSLNTNQAIVSEKSQQLLSSNEMRTNSSNKRSSKKETEDDNSKILRSAELNETNILNNKSDSVISSNNSKVRHQTSNKVISNSIHINNISNPEEYSSSNTVKKKLSELLGNDKNSSFIRNKNIHKRVENSKPVKNSTDNEQELQRAMVSDSISYYNSSNVVDSETLTLNNGKSRFYNTSNKSIENTGSSTIMPDLEALVSPLKHVNDSTQSLSHKRAAIPQNTDKNQNVVRNLTTSFEASSKSGSSVSPVNRVSRSKIQSIQKYPLKSGSSKEMNKIISDYDELDKVLMGMINIDENGEKNPSYFENGKNKALSMRKQTVKSIESTSKKHEDEVSSKQPGVFDHAEEMHQNFGSIRKSVRISNMSRISNASEDEENVSVIEEAELYSLRSSKNSKIYSVSKDDKNGEQKRNSKTLSKGIEAKQTKNKKKNGYTKHQSNLENNVPSKKKDTQKAESGKSNKIISENYENEISHKQQEIYDSAKDTSKDINSKKKSSHSSLHKIISSLREKRAKSHVVKTSKTRRIDEDSASSKTCRIDEDSAEEEYDHQFHTANQQQNITSKTVQESSTLRQTKNDNAPKKHSTFNRNMFGVSSDSNKTSENINNVPSNRNKIQDSESFDSNKVNYEDLDDVTSCGQSDVYDTAKDKSKQIIKIEKSGKKKRSIVDNRNKSHSERVSKKSKIDNDIEKEYVSDSQIVNWQQEDHFKATTENIGNVSAQINSVSKNYPTSRIQKKSYFSKKNKSINFQKQNKSKQKSSKKPEVSEESSSEKDKVSRDKHLNKFEEIRDISNVQGNAIEKMNEKRRSSGKNYGHSDYQTINLSKVPDLDNVSAETELTINRQLEDSDYEIEQISSEDVQLNSEGNLRRSDRNRYPPLEHWRNQRLVYAFNSGQFKNIGIDEGTANDTGSYTILSKMLNERKNHQNLKPAKIKKVDHYDNIYDKTFKVNLVHNYDSVPWDEPSTSSEHPYRIKRVFVTSTFVSGFIEINGLSEKPPQYMPEEDLQLTVLKGHIQASIQGNKFEVREKSMFMVPRNAPYSLKNLKNTKAIVSYVVGRFKFLESYRK